MLIINSEFKKICNLEILKELGKKDKPNLPVHIPADLVLSIAKIVEQSMGGSSGAVRYLLIIVFKTCFLVYCSFFIEIFLKYIDDIFKLCLVLDFYCSKENQYIVVIDGSWSYKISNHFRINYIF